MAVDPFTFGLVTGSSSGATTCYAVGMDATYFWFATYDSASTRYTLYRMRRSDSVLVQADGQVGNVGVDIGTSANFSQTSPIFCANGNVYLCGPAGIRIYTASSMSYAGTVHSTVQCAGGHRAVTDGIYWYFPTNNVNLFRFDPSTNSGTTIGTFATGGGTRDGAFDGTNLWFCNAGNYIFKVSTAGVQLAQYNTTFTGGVEELTYDPVSGHLFFLSNGPTIGIFRMDPVTGTPLNITGTTASWGAQTGLTGQGTPVGVTAANGWVYVWASNGNFWRFQTTGSAAGKVQILAGPTYYPCPWWSGGYAITLHHDSVAKRVLMATYHSGYFPAGLAWMPYDAAAVVPKVTRVTPRTTPAVRLAFDYPVLAGTPTLDAATGGLGVTGLSQIDTTTLELATDYPPTHPLGTATADDPPPAPRPRGATVT